MTTNDPFFDDEEELAQAEVAAAAEKPAPAKAEKAAKTADAEKPEPAGKVRKPPSFALVVAIAAVALLLGVCIGYFMAMAVVSSSTSATTASTTTVATASDDDDADDETGLPAGHLDLTQFESVDENGSSYYDMDKVAAWRAEHEADADDDAEAADGDDAAADEDDEKAAA
jgi:hypothetical protein